MTPGIQSLTSSAATGSVVAVKRTGSRCLRRRCRLGPEWHQNQVHLIVDQVLRDGQRNRLITLCTVMNG